MFTMICDNCGKDLCENEEFSAWNDESALYGIADNSDWSTYDKHYCPNCFFYDEDDNVIVKERIKL